MKKKKKDKLLELSDADCDRLARKCGEYGLTIGELIENFVGDLVDGTYPTEVMRECMHNSGLSVVGLECSRNLRFSIIYFRRT